MTLALVPTSTMMPRKLPPPPPNGGPNEPPRLTEALVLAKEWIACHVRELVASGVDVEDAESAAWIGAWCGTDGWDPARGRSWHSYVLYCVEKSVSEVRRDYGRMRSPAYRAMKLSQVSLDAFPAWCQAEPEDLDNLDAPELDTPSIPDDVLETSFRQLAADLDLRVVIEEAIVCLPERDRIVVRDLYFYGRTGGEVARALGVTERTVRNIRVRALGELRGLLGGL